jgi:hypothetical protein
VLLTIVTKHCQSSSTLGPQTSVSSSSSLPLTEREREREGIYVMCGWHGLVGRSMFLAPEQLQQPAAAGLRLQVLLTGVITRTIF